MLMLYLSLLEEDERDEFSKIYQENHLKMYHVALSTLKHKEDAENAVHDAFISLAENFKRYRGLDDVKITSLCNVIVRNKAIDIIRKRTNRAESSLEEEWMSPADVEVESVIIDLENQEEIQKMLESLDERTKLILILKYFHDYKNGEIAKILNLSKRAVEMRLHRVKQQFRENENR